MWRGPDRSYDRSADAASGGYEQWSQQTRGDPSAELAARYAVPTGFGATAASAMTPPAAMAAAGRCVHTGAIWNDGATMGSSSPSGCECGSGAGCCTVRAADGYGYDGTAGNGDTDAVGAGGHVCAGTDGDDGGAFDISTTIRSGCNELSTTRRRRSRRGRGSGRG